MVDQKYTSIHMMDFENHSEQMIEEEIDDNQSAATPFAAKGVSANTFTDEFTEDHRTYSNVLSSNSRMPSNF